MNMFLWLLDFVRHSSNFFPSFSILVYNNTIISLRLSVYYLIIANSGLRPSFAIYQATYDSPSRDNCKLSGCWWVNNPWQKTFDFLMIYILLRAYFSEIQVDIFTNLESI